MLPSLLIAASLLSPSSAASAEGGVQAALFGGGLEFVEDQLAGLSYGLTDADMGGEVGCYDELGVHGIDLFVPLDTVAIEIKDGELELTARFGQIYAEDFEVYGIDEDYFDACVEFDADVEYVELNDAVLQLTLAAEVVDGGLSLEVTSGPTLQADLDTDINWFPDDLALAYFEETILEAVAEQIGSALPAVAETYLGESIFGSEYGQWAFEIGLADADLSGNALTLAATPEISWTGSDGCPEDRSDGNLGENPQLSFGSGDGSDVAFGVTEAVVNDLLLSAWRDGYFCFTEDNVAEFIDLVASAFDPNVADLRGTASLSNPPEVYIDDDGLHLRQQDIGMEITGEFNGQRGTLLEIRGDVYGSLELGLDQGLTAFTMSLHELTLDIGTLDADHLVEQGQEGENQLRRFIEDFVAGFVADMITDMPLFSSLYYAFDVAIRVDDVQTEPGGLRVYISLFDSDDPEVDTVAPDTEFALVEATTEYAEIAVWGTDDHLGPLAYAAQVDGGGWTSWTTNPTIRLSGLDAGEIYQVEVISRDQWLNVDPTPATGWLELGDGGETTKQCACASGARSPLGWGLVALLLGLVVRRRAGSSG